MPYSNRDSPQPPRGAAHSVPATLRSSRSQSRAAAAMVHHYPNSHPHQNDDNDHDDHDHDDLDDDDDDEEGNPDDYYEEFSDSDLLPENLDDHYDIRSSNVYHLLHSDLASSSGPLAASSSSSSHAHDVQHLLVRQHNEDYEAYRARLDSAEAARAAAAAADGTNQAHEDDHVNLDNILAHLSSDDDADPNDMIVDDGEFDFSEDDDPSYLSGNDDDDQDSLDSQEEYEQEHLDSLRASSGVGRRARARRQRGHGRGDRSGRGRPRGGASGGGGGRRRNDPNTSAAVQPYILAAQSAYFDHQLDAAMQACHQALFVEPKADLVYRLMGIVHESRGDMQRAMRTYMVMAHLIPRDYDIWRKVAVFAREVGGSDREMIHCYRKAMQADPRDTVVPWKLILVYESRGQVSAKVEVYRHLLKQLPWNMLLVRDLVRILLQRGDVKEAAQVYVDALTYHARGKFKHPWTPPSTGDMQEKIKEGNDPMLERIVYRKRPAKESTEGIDAGTGAATLDDLLDAARVLLDVKRFDELVTLVKRVVRWFQGRVEETDEFEQPDAHVVIEGPDGEAVVTVDESIMDAEYDPSLHPRPALHPDFPDGGAGLPLDFRVILGVCRLQLGHLQAGKRHFQYLASLGVTAAAMAPGEADQQIQQHQQGMPGWTLNVHELYQLVWQAYMDAGMYQDAVPFLDAAIAGAEALVPTTPPPPPQLNTGHADGDAVDAEAAAAAAEAAAAATVNEWIDTHRAAALASMYFNRGVCLARLASTISPPSSSPSASALDPQAQLHLTHLAIQSLEHALMHDQFALEPREELAALYQRVGNTPRAFQMLTDAEALIDNKQVDSVLFARRPDMRGKTRRKRVRGAGKLAGATEETGGAKGGRRKRGRPKGSGTAGGQRGEHEQQEDEAPLLSPTALVTPSVAMFPDSAAAAAAAAVAATTDGMQDGQPVPSTATTEAARLSQRGSRKVALAIKEREMKLKFTKMALVGGRFDQLDARARRDYLASAASLYETFRNTAAFYPSDRTVTFAGVDASGRIRNTKIQHARFVQESEYQVVERRMFLAPRARYNPEELASMTQDAKLILQAKSYLGYSLDQWFDHLMLYCVALVKNFQSDLAFKVLHDVADANIFWHDNDKMVRMHIIGCSLAVAAQRPNDAAQYARWLVMNHPYTSNVYRIYAAAMCAGTRDRLAFASTNCQKFFKRMLLQRFSGTIRTHMTPHEVEMYGANPQLPVKDEPERVWSAKPLLLTLYGHILSCAASYLPAIVHYVRAYSLSPNDPMINFALGSAYLHRAMQRKSDNRHLQIAQGLAFVFRYAEYSEHPKTLVMYNLGRAFHQIGLLPLATRYYRLALEEAAVEGGARQDGMSTGGAEEQQYREVSMRYAKYAAYNLTLIYQQSNSLLLARRIMQEYLTV